MAAIFQDPQTWYALAFVIFAIGAWRFGKTPVLAILDARIEAIRMEIAAAEDLHTEAQELLSQYLRKQRDADKEVARIIETTRAHAAQYRAQGQADLIELLAQRSRRLTQRLCLMEAEAVCDIQKQAAHLVTQRAATLLAQRAQDKLGAALIDSSIQEAKALIAA